MTRVLRASSASALRVETQTQAHDSVADIGGVPTRRARQVQPDTVPLPSESESDRKALHRAQSAARACGEALHRLCGQQAALCGHGDR